MQRGVAKLMTLPMPGGLEIEIEIPANAPNDHHIPVTRGTSRFCHASLLDWLNAC